MKHVIIAILLIVLWTLSPLIILLSLTTLSGFVVETSDELVKILKDRRYFDSDSEMRNGKK